MNENSKIYLKFYKMNNTTTLSSDEFNSPLKPYILDSIAVFLSIIGITCFISNSYLIITFIRFKELHTSLNVLILAISFSNLIGTFQFPFVISSYLKHRYM
jgi:hypothetical protein